MPDLLLRCHLFVQFGQALRILHRAGEAGALVVVGEALDMAANPRISNGRGELRRRLRWSLADAAPGQALEHPQVPEAGRRGGSALRVPPRHGSLEAAPRLRNKRK